MSDFSPFACTYFTSNKPLCLVPQELSVCSVHIIYDVGVHANDVNSTIMQSTFDKTIPFKPCEYCKESFGYDAVGLDQIFDELHEKLYLIDIDQPSSKEIIGYFAAVHPELMKLRTEVRSTLNELNVRFAMIQRTII